MPAKREGCVYKPNEILCQVNWELITEFRSRFHARVAYKPTAGVLAPMEIWPRVVHARWPCEAINGQCLVESVQFILR